ncbi:MAG: glycoside hydrolase family 2 TIM barrel-domain containing protein [Bacteroidales bacterium]
MKKLICLALVVSNITACTNRSDLREEICLNGSWEIARTDTLEDIPSFFNSKIQVPGLIDMAVPSVNEQDTAYANSLYWYRRTFRVDDPSADLIILKINKARYHTKVWINRQKAGENVYSFTPSFFNIKPYISKDGNDNEIIISVGCRNNLPDTVTNGWDFEKIKYIPGIYDDVKIIYSGYPYIENVQVAPDIMNNSVRVRAEIKTRTGRSAAFSYVVNESATGIIRARGNSRATGGSKFLPAVADFVIPVDSCRLWSPENPFLYKLELITGGDRKTTTFGMRSFAASPDSGIFLLNGKPYYLRGTNVCIYRFFEDPERGELPWDSEWVAKLHSRFRDMNWTAIRYCIGFPPERWYEIADSMGFLIQDEYPLWTLAKPNFSKYLGSLNSVQLAREYREWMRERWNHPCVVIWDAQNESMTDTTGKAIERVRSLDLSGRPWDNGWAVPVSETDAIESHPYLFDRYQRQKPAPEGYLKELFSDVRIPGNDPNSHYPLPGSKRYENPIILNEYGWIWLNRDGSTTTLTDKVYENVWPWADSPEERFEIYAKTLGILTEYWRVHRKAAAVMHFCGLGYSRPERPRGQTSDHFVDLKNLTYEPYFLKYVRPAFSPVGLMIDFWDNHVSKGQVLSVPVHLINDTYESYDCILRISLTQGGKPVHEESIPVSVDAMGKNIYTMSLVLPSISGSAMITAEIDYGNEAVKSIREFIIK